MPKINRQKYYANSMPTNAAVVPNIELTIISFPRNISPDTFPGQLWNCPTLLQVVTQPVTNSNPVKEGET